MYSLMKTLNTLTSILKFNHRIEGNNKNKQLLLSPKYKPYDMKEEILNKAIKEMSLADRIRSRKFSSDVKLRLKNYCFNLHAGKRESIKQKKDELRFQPQVALVARK